MRSTRFATFAVILGMAISYLQLTLSPTSASGATNASFPCYYCYQANNSCLMSCSYLPRAQWEQCTANCDADLQNCLANCN